MADNAFRPREIRATPRNVLMGLLSDALTTGRDFADRAQIPQGVPLIGGQGVGSLLMGRAPEELNEWAYGNAPMSVNALAGRTASYVPQMKLGRKQQVADLLMLAQLPGGKNALAAGAGGLLDSGAVNQAMHVWHGSPHKFDKFDSSKIGTGEGQQVYGHGLYLAEAKDAGEEYARALSPRVSISVDGVALPAVPRSGSNKYSLIRPDVENLLVGANGDVNKAIQRAKSFIAGADHPQIDKAAFQRSLATLEGMAQRGAKIESMPGQGNLYKVDLPDEKIARMLDWDKPLSQQAPEVRAALPEFARRGTASPNGVRALTGEEIVQELGAQHAARLRRAGIPGIRYLDGGSRGAGAGSSNFVVFPGEEDALRILERNGKGLR